MEPPAARSRVAVGGAPFPGPSLRFRYRRGIEFEAERVDHGGPRVAGEQGVHERGPGIFGYAVAHAVQLGECRMGAFEASLARQLQQMRGPARIARNPAAAQMEPGEMERSMRAAHARRL